MAREPFFEQMYGQGVRYDDREWRLLLAHLTGTASGITGGWRRPRPSWAEAIAELRQITEDPAVLADAAAEVAVMSRDWYRGDELQLLLDAGADPDLVVEYVDQRRARLGRGFDLGAFAQALGETGRR